jgi:LacI family transcriptional regulator
MRDHADVGAVTRAHVREAIELLGYRPSPIARALVAGQSRLLTLLVSDITNPFYPQLAKSVEQEAKKEGYAVVICNTEDRTAETRRYVERLLAQGLDGVIHASVARDEQVLLSLMADDRRVVFTNRRPANSAVSYVVSDNENGAAELTRHLLSLGHRRIGFITGPRYARNGMERLKGCRYAMRQVSNAQLFVAEGDFSVESGHQAVLGWTRSQQMPTAVIAVSDSVALGALGALSESRLRVPEDVALAGFDGTQLSASPLLSLTTIDQHIEELGRRSVQILLGQLTGSGVFEPVQQVLPSRLLVRRSTLGAGADPRSYDGVAANG